MNSAEDIIKHVPVKIKQIAEVALVVTDLERSRRFYKDVLGLEEFHYDKLKPGTGVTFHLGNGYIGLWLPGEWPRINPHLGAIEDPDGHMLEFWGRKNF